uniref:Uncharacterized protein n=1 Tax=Panagrolaimus superbus TaxID=310955 RepID=A0A914Z521_9BILA
MNVNIYETSLVKAESPEINFKFQNPHSFSVKTSGGFAQFKGLYKGVYRTCRDGQVYIDLSGLNLYLQVDLTRSDENKFHPKISSCEFSVDEIFVEMKRPLFPQAIDAFKQLFLKYLSKQMCKFAENYADKIGDKFQEALNNSPISLKELGLHKFDSTLIREPILDKNSLFFALNGKFGQKEESERSRMFETDTNHMIYTYISEFVFNEFLNSFENKELKIEKSKKMDELLKNYKLMKSEDSMDIRIKFNEAPKIQFMDYGAKLVLNFNALLKSSSSDESLVSANFKLKTLIEKFEINAVLDGIFDDNNNNDDDYKLNAKVTIDDIEITDIISFLPEAFNLAEILPHVIKANKDIFGEIIESNLHSLFPIETNSYLRVTTIKGFFRSKTLIFGFDFASDGHLIRRLQLP